LAPIHAWEKPFGYVTTMDTVDKWEISYGDMAPLRNGPEPQTIYRKDGHDDYLKQNFLKLTNARFSKGIFQRGGALIVSDDSKMCSFFFSFSTTYGLLQKHQRPA
jgi:hypothetical protein